MKIRFLFTFVASSVVSLTSFEATAQIVRSSSGLNAASITPTVTLFQNDLGGGAVSGPNGSFGGLRREINWDGVPDALSAPANLPLNFFNVNSPRGAVFSTPGSGVQVSATSTFPPIQFGNIDASYPTVFEPFSAQRLFTPIGSNIVDVNFFIPGTTIPSLTRGFGSVFSDVDLANTTSIELFSATNSSLGSFFVPNAQGSETFSFLGVSFPTPVVARVRITNGNAALGAGLNDQNGDNRDLVAMDDFIFAEPVPEPTSALAALGVMVVGGLSRGRRCRPTTTV